MIAPRQTPSSHSTSCPQCGGTANEVPGRRYLQCAYCESLVFPGESPLETDGITPLGTQLESGCPCCEEPLQQGEIDGHPALYCGRCYGVLIRNGAFGDVIRNRRAAREQQQGVDVRPINPDEYARTLHCPACQNRMETHPYYGPGNVVIDSCSDCAYVWLDHGELATLERANGHRESVRSTTVEPESPAVLSEMVPQAEPSPLETLFNLLF